MDTMRHMALAISFLTRIPIRRLDLAKTDFARAVVYFPLVGAGIGLIGSAVFLAAHAWFSIDISVVLALGCLMLITGALHEDGLADSFDAFGSKTKKKDILEVMHDSRLGTYGTLALIMAILLKYLSLSEMRPAIVCAALIVVHMVSRWAMVLLLARLPYPRKTTPLTKRFIEAIEDIPKWHIGVATFYTGVLTVLLVGIQGVVLLLVTGLLCVLFGRYFLRKLQGATGDCYGMVQQCVEVALYLTILQVL